MGKSRTGLYEMMLILKPLLPDDVRKSVHKSILELSKELGGEIRDVDVWGKRYLAYKIAGHAEGYYIVYVLEIPSSSVKEFRRQMDLKQEVLRYLFVEVDAKEVQKKGIKKKELDLNV
jgi:small subunit ribosomal protein S6